MTAKTSQSPHVDHIEWGKVDVGGQSFRDVKLFPGGGRSWDWGETGMHHVPGIQPADLEELIAKGSEVLVLSRGMQLVLQVPDSTVKYAEQRGLRVEVLESKLAVARYNELAIRERVGALIHSTC